MRGRIYEKARGSLAGLLKNMPRKLVTARGSLARFAHDSDNFNHDRDLLMSAETDVNPRIYCVM